MTTSEKDLQELQGALADPDALLSEDKRAVNTKEGPKVKLKDEEFLLAEEMGAFAYMQFAAAADLDVTDPQGTGAVYWMLKDIIHEKDWSRFIRYAVSSKASGDELLDVVTAAMEKLAARPTKQSGNSSAGSSGTTPSSTGGSSGGRGRASKR